MHKIVRKDQLNDVTHLLEFEAADLAAAAKPGQFVIFRIDETGERFPLTLYDHNAAKGTITVVCQAAGVSTRKLCALKKGDSVLDIAGPLGHATDTKRVGRVICVGGGVGIAEIYPIARAMRANGNDVTVILGARNKDLLICEKEIRSFCDKVLVATDDGSNGRKGFVTDHLRDELNAGPCDLVFAVGPAIMMKMVSEMTRPKGVRTLVSLNAIMIDGTGMCGGCRIRYKGKTSFVCVEGPEFDSHQVDFEDLMRRQAAYRDKERQAMDRYEHQCRIGLGQP